MNVTIDCICPPKGDAPRHPDGDTVTLRDKLDFRAATTIRWAIKVLKSTPNGSSFADVLAMMTETYLLNGIEDWTLVDEKGKPIDVSPQEIRDRLLTNLDAAQTVSDVADDLYLEVMLPLLQRDLQSSPPTSTSESTSQRKADSKSQTDAEDTSSSTSSRKPRKPSRPSSISTIPTAATTVTSRSLDGDSSSSQSSTSAA